MKKKEKRRWQRVALFVIVIGFTLIMTCANITNISPIYDIIIFIILGMLLIVVGTVSWAILQFYY